MSGFFRAVLLFCVLSLPSMAWAQSETCPNHATRIKSDDKHWYCACDAGFIWNGQSCANTAVNLAPDNSAACLSAAQVRVIDRRVEGIKKALAVLSDSNPEWARERDRLLDEMFDTGKGVAIDGTFLAARGLSVWRARAAKVEVDKLEKLNEALRGYSSELANEASRLRGLASRTTDIRLQAAINYQASAARKLAEASEKYGALEAADKGVALATKTHETYEILGQSDSTKEFANKLYWGSAVVGSFAMVFVSPTIAPVVAGAELASGAIITGREAYNFWEEYGRLKALDQNASDRNRMKMELQKRLNDLDEQRKRALYVIQRSGPAKNCKL